MCEEKIESPLIQFAPDAAPEVRACCEFPGRSGIRKAFEKPRFGLESINLGYAGLLGSPTTSADDITDHPSRQLAWRFRLDNKISLYLPRIALLGF